MINIIWPKFARKCSIVLTAKFHYRHKHRQEHHRMRTKLELLDLTAKQFVILDSLCFRTESQLDLKVLSTSVTIRWVFGLL